MKAASLPRLLSPGAISEATGLPRATVYQLIARGEIPAIRYQVRDDKRESIRVVEADFLAWVERRRQVGAR